MRDKIRACADVREGCEVGLGRARNTNQLGLWGDFSTLHLCLVYYGQLTISYEYRASFI